MAKLTEERFQQLPIEIRGFFTYLRNTCNMAENSVNNYYKAFDVFGSIVQKSLKKMNQTEFEKAIKVMQDKYSSSSINTYLTALKSLYKYLIGHDYIEKSPISPHFRMALERQAPIVVLMPKHNEHIYQLLDRELKSCRKNYDPENKDTVNQYRNLLMKSLAIRILIDTGCRTQELLQIRDKDILGFPSNGHKDNRRLCRIYNAKTKSGNQAYKSRDLVINEETVTVYYEYMQVADAKVKTSQKPLLPVSDRTLRYWITKKGTGLKSLLMEKDFGCFSGLTAHSFRKYFCSRLRAHGIEDKVIDYLMGHANSSMTDRYASIHFNDVLHAFNAAISNHSYLPTEKEKKKNRSKAISVPDTMDIKAVQADDGRLFRMKKHDPVPEGLKEVCMEDIEAWPHCF